MQLGESFDDVRKVISISILNFPISNDDEYLYHGKTTFVGVNTGKPKPVKMAPYSKQGTAGADNLFLDYYLIEVEHF